VGAQPAPDLDREPAPPTGLARNGLIAFDSDGDIWVADPDGGDPRFFVSGPGLDIDPTFSPDGTKLAFWSLEVGEDALITIDDNPDTTTVSRMLGSGTASLMVSEVNATGASEPRAIVTGLHLDSQLGPAPSWSPGSDALAYSHLEAAGHEAIDIVEIAGSETRRVASGDGPSWSPDGSRLAYRSPTYPPGVMVVDVDGSDPHQITAARGAGMAFALPQWAPDGQTVAFFGGNDGQHDIWTAAADGSSEEVVSDDVVDEFWPAWSPDGSHLAFQQAANPGAQVIVVDARDGWSRTRLESESLGSVPVVWSPDGRRLVGFRFDPSAPEAGGIAVLAVADTAATEDFVIDVSSPWFSASWQRLAP
jgi:TolB protein